MDNLMQRPLTIGFIFEGPTEEETVPVLLAQILNREIEVKKINKQTPGFNDFKRPIRQPQRAELRGSWGTLKSYILSLLILQVDAIVIVVDNDCEEPAILKRWSQFARNLPVGIRPLQIIDCSRVVNESLEAGLEVPLVQHIVCAPRPEQTPVIIGISVQMLEAWLLANPATFQSILWEPFTAQELQRCASPEQIADPVKEILSKRIGQDKLSQKQAKAIAAHPDFSPGPIEARRPSFVGFAGDVRSLAGLP